MTGCRIYIGMVLLLFAWEANAATYYIDQTGGDDNRAGTSPGTAWRNCPGMSSYGGTGTLNPGDTVYFDCSDTWLVTGTQGLFITGGVTYIGDSWGTGTKAIIRADSDLDAGVIRFRDHNTFETVFRGFEVDANGRVATGIDLGHRFGTLMTGAMKMVENCDVHNIWSRASAGQYKYGIIISNHGGSSYVVENVMILNTAVHDTSRDAICLYPGDENAGCQIRNITVRGCEAYNTGQDPDYSGGSGIVIKGNVVDAFIEYNYAHDLDAASIFINGNETNHFGFGPTNVHIRYNILTCNNMHGAIRIYDNAGQGDPKDIKIYGNIIYNSTTGGGFQINGLSNTLALMMYNNTFFNAPIIINRSSANITTFEVRNNIFYYPGGNPFYDQDGDITAQSNNVTGNPAFRDPGGIPVGFTGTYGVDMRPNTDGLALQPGSTGIDRGTPLPVFYNGSINSVLRPAGRGWDIGAYESGTSQASRPAPPTRIRIKG
jgi:hypothetical protein